MKKQLLQLIGNWNEYSWTISWAGMVASYASREEEWGTSAIEMMLEPFINTK